MKRVFINHVFQQVCQHEVAKELLPMLEQLLKMDFDLCYATCELLHSILEANHFISSPETMLMAVSIVGHTMHNVADRKTSLTEEG